MAIPKDGGIGRVGFLRGTGIIVLRKVFVFSPRISALETGFLRTTGFGGVGFLLATGLGGAGFLLTTGAGFLRTTGLGGVGRLRTTGLGGVGFLLTTGAGFLRDTGLGGAGFLLATGLGGVDFLRTTDLGVSTLGATALFLGVTGREGRRTFVRLLFVGVVRRVGALLTAFLALLRLPRMINTYQKDFVKNN